MSATSIADTGVGTRRSPLRNPFRLLVSPEPWLAFLFMLFSFVLGVFWFVVLVTLIAFGSGMVITLVGLPVLALTMLLWIQGARLERVRVRAFLGEPIRDPYQPAPEDANWWVKLKTRLVDRYTWLDLLYLFLLFPIGIAEFVIATTAVAFPLSLTTMPAYYWVGAEIFTIQIDTLPKALVVAVSSLPLLLIAPYVMVGVGRGHAWLARHLLGSDREAELEARVGRLTVSRSQALESAVGDLRRIERDLHDGAQQRLVKLSMDLGLAREKMASDPEAAEALISEAHEEAKRAMSEIRNLARGIHPAVLTDRGLDAAVSALAGRSTVPVTVDIELAERLPDAVESNAYFIIAEALTNIARHSEASRARIRVRQDAEHLYIDVEDDGQGGADAARGSGLAGMADRVDALDGTLAIDSKPGEGTHIHVELPCES
jgi:signal transduction histidine kinase